MKCPPQPSSGTRGAALLALVATVCSDDDSAPADGIEPVGEVVGEGDTYEAIIRRTEGGVPHIIGGSRADIAFGQGYASGEDRACDLADQVLKIRGERARWHGPGEATPTSTPTSPGGSSGFTTVRPRTWMTYPNRCARW